MKSLCNFQNWGTVPSLPSWECGLKFHGYVMQHPTTSSLPSWECGLKSMYLLGVSVICDVTPFLGVWIEIYETSIIPDAVWSLPSWECGLKFCQWNQQRKDRVTPFLGVWIEIDPPPEIKAKIRSLPSWECGLKWI